MSEHNEASGRITTKEFYVALLDVNDRMDTMERRILERVDQSINMQRDYQQQTDARLAAGTVRFENFDDDIKDLKKWDRGIGILSVIGSIIASAIGMDK